MKNLFLLITLLFLSIAVNSQSATELGKISLSVIMPENVDGLDASQLSKLNTKITQIVTNAGLGASGFDNNFVIYPKFAIYETNVVEGGMQNIIVAKCDVSIFIQQLGNKLLFSSISKILSGSGSSKEIAITNAISKIDVSDNAYKLFVETGKKKIINYYETKCSDIILKAESLTKKQDYEQALGLLVTVPEEVSCFNKVQEKTIDVYKAYQDQKCKVLIQQANLKMTNTNYDSALAILAQIDPSSTCSNEAHALMHKMETKINTEQKRQLDFQMKVYNDNLALEKQRINAVKDIAVAYYSNRPKVTYNMIVR
jgi:hypothetical protein